MGCVDSQTAAPPRPVPRRPSQAPRPSHASRPTHVSKKKIKLKTAKDTRLKTKYRREDIFLVSDDDRHEKRVKSYCCPICTLYYTRIIACNSCVNFICLNCFEDYDKKTAQKKQKLKCPFCSSEKSFFCDYELDPHSYFDASGKGFLTQEEREKLEEGSDEMKIEEEREEEHSEQERDEIREDREERQEEGHARPPEGAEEGEG